MEILKPTPDEALKLNDYYTLQSSCDSKIKPAVLAKSLPSPLFLFFFWLENNPDLHAVSFLNI